MMSKNLKPGSVLLIVVLVVAVLVVAFIFVFKFSDLGTKQEVGESNVVGDEQVRKLETLSDSDEIGAIEADINSTNLENLDQELNQVDQELPSL